MVDQTGSHRILADVLDFLGQTLVRSQNVVEELVLPHRAGPVQEPIDCMRGAAFSQSQDLGQTPQPTFAIAKRSKDHVYMSRHHD